MKDFSKISLLLFVWLGYSCNQVTDSTEIVRMDQSNLYDPEESLIYLDELLEEDDDNTELLYKKGLIQYELSMYEEAERTLAAIEPEDASEQEGIALLKARIYCDRGEFDKALQHTLPIYLDGPARIDVNDLLSDIYAGKNEFDKVNKHLAICLDLDSANPKYQFMLARVYQANNDTIDALRNYDKSLLNGYANPEGIMIYSDFLTSIGQGEKALVLLDDMAESQNDISMTISYGKALLSIGHYGEAKAYLLEALVEHSDNMELNQVLSRTYVEERNLDSAAIFAERLLEIDSGQRVGYWEVASVYRAQNRVYAAMGVLSKGLERFPDDSLLNAESEKLANYIAYLQRTKQEYEERVILPELKPIRIDKN